MYHIKSRKKGPVIFAIISLLALSAIGAGIAIAGARISGKTPESDYLKSFDNPIPTEEAIFQNEETESVINTEITINEPEVSTPPEEYLYLIKLENGKTKVYNLGENSIVYSHELPIEPGALPPNDMQSLKEGIYLKTKDELLSFTEDFCS